MTTGNLGCPKKCKLLEQNSPWAIGPSDGRLPNLTCKLSFYSIPLHAKSLGCDSESAGHNALGKLWTASRLSLTMRAIVVSWEPHPLQRCITQANLKWTRNRGGRQVCHGSGPSPRLYCLNLLNSVCSGRALKAGVPLKPKTMLAIKTPAPWL